jgi:hypothetical protein
LKESGVMPPHSISLSCGLLFREQIFQIRRRKAAGETFLAQHVGNGLRLVLLQFPDFFLNGSGCNQPVGVDGLRLADTV